MKPITSVPLASSRLVQPSVFSKRPRLLNLSDQMELAAGRFTETVELWRNRAALAQRLEASAEAPADQIVLAASGPELVL